MGFLPDQNAVACREQAIGYVIKKIGYKPVLIGISESIPLGEFEKKICGELECYSISYARTIKEKIKDTFFVEKTLVSILKDVGIERIKCFIMQDYQLWPMKRVARFCSNNGIAFSADVMDWFTPSRDYPWIKNIIKGIDTVFRMYGFYPCLKNKIFITNKFEDFFSKSKKYNSLVFPCTCIDALEANKIKDLENHRITITFAGFMGKKCEKEKLDWLIKALFENNSEIELNIIGITQEEFVNNVPELTNKITEYIHFYGYLPHNECIKILEQSDFAVIIRKCCKLTEYGFSSKICEAFAHGVPVITTNISDNSLYISNGVNGYICDADYESVKKLLKRIEKLTIEERNEIRYNLCEDNPLSIRNYIGSFSKFVDKLEV